MSSLMTLREREGAQLDTTTSAKGSKVPPLANSLNHGHLAQSGISLGFFMVVVRSCAQREVVHLDTAPKDG